MKQGNGLLKCYLEFGTVPNIRVEASLGRIMGIIFDFPSVRIHIRICQGCKCSGCLFLFF